MVQTEYNLKEWAKGRYAIYTYLADCYLDIPSAETVKAARRFAPAFEGLAENAGGAMQEGARLFTQFAEQAAAAQEGNFGEFLEKLNMEYTSLFMIGDLSIPFYESAFMGETDLQKSEIRMDVYHFFARRHFERRGPLNIPEDALCHELDYMAGMSALMLADETGGQSLIPEQLAFMQEHLSRWIEPFTRRVLERAGRENSLFYMAATTLTEAFVRFDLEILLSLSETATES